MSFAVIFAIGLGLAVLSAFLMGKNRNAVECLVLGLVWFFAGHIFSSMALFVLDLYAVFRNICLTAAFHFAAAGLLCFRNFRQKKPLKEWITADFSLKPVLIPLLVCLLAFPLTSVKNEFFGMGQDQGVYQTQVIRFLHGDTQRQSDFAELDTLTTDKERSAFLYAVHNYLRGYDVGSANYPDTVYDRSRGEDSGIIHGIPTYSAVLTSWAVLFGMAHMLDVETLFYFLVIFLVWMICRNLGLHRCSGLCACLVTAAAPVVVWVSKSSLTEIFLTVLVTWFLYHITAKENQWLSVFPLAAFACYHVSIYTMIPLFLMVYGGLYVFTRQRQYGVLLPVTVIGYLASFFMMRQVQPFYTMNNYSPVFGKHLDQHNLPLAVSAVCLGLLAVLGIFLFVMHRHSRDFDAEGFRQKAENSRAFRIFLSCLLLLPFLYLGVKYLFTFSSVWDIKSVTIWSYAANTGLFLIPAAVCTAVLLPRYLIQDIRRLAVYLMFFYCVPVYAAVLRPEIQHYYYYARYLAPFIPLACVFSVMILDRFGKKVLCPVVLCGLAVVFPYDRYLIRAKDDSRMEWSVMEDVTDCVDGETCVVLEKTFCATLWMPIRSICRVPVYPLDDEDPAQLERMAQKFSRILYITPYEPENAEDYTLCYRNVIHRKEDDLLHTGRLLPMSSYFQDFADPIYVYEIVQQTARHSP